MCRIVAGFAKTYSCEPPVETMLRLRELFTFAAPLAVSKRGEERERPTAVKELLCLLQTGAEKVKEFKAKSLLQSWEDDVRTLLADDTVLAYLNSLQVRLPFSVLFPCGSTPNLCAHSGGLQP
jgi:hypothetical protein